MILSKLQKELIELIENRVIYDISSLQSHYKFDEFNNFNSVVSKLAGRHIYTPLANSAEEEVCTNYIIIKHFLHKHNLIIILKSSENNEWASVYTKGGLDASDRAASRLQDTLKLLGDEIIIPTTELRLFIQRNYRTIEEYNLEQEKHSRKIAQRTTIAIAILVPLINILINFYFNHITTKSYNVKLLNCNKTESIAPPELIEKGDRMPKDTVEVN